MELSAFREVAGDVSRETFLALERYGNLLARWTKRINLVAPGTLGDLWTRHIVDSAQIFSLAPPGARVWADLGSGGGLPGVVLAIIAQERAPATRFVLVEADQRKAAFLRNVNRELGLGVTIHAGRIESLAPLGADCITARALAPLPKLLEYMLRHGADGAVGIFPKGAHAEDELAAALDAWSFACEKIPSATSPESLVLKIGDLRRA